MLILQDMPTLRNLQRRKRGGKSGAAQTAFEIFSLGLGLIDGFGK